MKKLLQMLTYMRPAGSKAEEEFIRRYIKSYRPARMGQNLMIVVPGDPKTMFSCHTDTVHRMSGKQLVMYDAELNIAYKDDKDPLGGDDTVGVYILLELIKAKVPGTYMFHYGEERGCIGSHALAKEQPAWLKSFNRAIAFDRRGTTSVITHQRGDRCCSALFGQAVADALANKDLKLEYKLDDTGLYTDTASYMELIPECTNLSVGYDHEHTPNEMVDIGHVEKLVEQAITVEWSKLPTHRDPKVHERKTYSYGQGYGGYGGSHSHWEGDYEDGGWWNAAKNKGKNLLKNKASLPANEDVTKYPGDDMTMREIDTYLRMAELEIKLYEDALDMVESEPELAAQILLAYVIDSLIGSHVNPVTTINGAGAVVVEKNPEEMSEI